MFDSPLSVSFSRALFDIPVSAGPTYKECRNQLELKGNGIYKKRLKCVHCLYQKSPKLFSCVIVVKIESQNSLNVMSYLTLPVTAVLIGLLFSVLSCCFCWCVC